MTEWSASGYARISTLQAAMASEVLGLLDLEGTERVLSPGEENFFRFYQMDVTLSTR
jgi:hypothetical protein